MEIEDGTTTERNEIHIQPWQHKRLRTFFSGTKLLIIDEISSVDHMKLPGKLDKEHKNRYRWNK